MIVVYSCVRKITKKERLFCSWHISVQLSANGFVVIYERYQTETNKGRGALCISGQIRQQYRVAVRLISSSLSSSSHLPRNRGGRWGTTDDFAASFPPSSLFSTALWDLVNSRPVHFLMLSSHLFLCLPFFFPSFTVSCKIALARPDESEVWSYYCSLRLFTMVRRSSCSPIACWVLAGNSSLVIWSLYEMPSILR